MQSNEVLRESMVADFGGISLSAVSSAMPIRKQSRIRNLEYCGPNFGTGDCFVSLDVFQSQCLLWICWSVCRVDDAYGISDTLRAVHQECHQIQPTISLRLEELPNK